MKTMKKYITGLLVMLSSTFVLAQESAQPTKIPCTKNYYNNDYLYRNNFWLQGNNAAGLIFNDKILNAVNVYSQFEGTVAHSDGSYRNIFTPVSEQEYQLNALSYMNLDKVYLYGNFTYDYTFKRDVQWHGMLNPYTSPFMMSDSVPGNQLLERFSFVAGIALPLSKYFSAGVYMDYTALRAAKQRDLRNENTYMNLLIRPGVLFHYNKWKLGLNFMYEKTTELIEYKEWDENTSKTVFYINGLWFYTYEIYSISVDARRRKHDDRLGGAFQLEFTTGDFSYYNEFSASYCDGFLSEKGYNNKQYGDTEIAGFRYDGKISYKNKHRLTGFLDISSMLGYKFIQRSALDPTSGTNQWTTYDRVNSYVRNAVEYEAAYTFDQPRNECNNEWSLTAGIKGYTIENAYKIYPLKYVQQWNYTETFATFNKNLLLKSGMLDINPNLSYGWGNGVMNDKRTMNGMTIEEVEEYMPPTEQAWQLLEPLAAEFAFMTADHLNVGIHCRYTYFLNKKTGYNLYGDFRYNYVYALSDVLKDTHRNYFSLTVGLSF